MNHRSQANLIAPKLASRRNQLAILLALAMVCACQAEIGTRFMIAPPKTVASPIGPVPPPSYSLVISNGYGDWYWMNMLRDRSNYQAYRGVCQYRGFSLSGCSTTGEVIMLRIKGTPSMPEHLSILSTSLRWGTEMYVLNDVFHPLDSWVMAGYENWFPFDMSCSVAMYINSGGFGFAGSTPPIENKLVSPFDVMSDEDRAALLAPAPNNLVPPPSYSLVISNGYGDVYRMNLMRNRENYQAYRGVCSYRGFALSGCSTTGHVVMLRIKATPSMPEHLSIVSTSMRWGTTMYFLNDVFHPLCSWVMAGYENWYPFDMSCSVAMYISSGGFGATPVTQMPVQAKRSFTPFDLDNGTGTNLIGVLLPLSGDLAFVGQTIKSALDLAYTAITNDPSMPPFQLVIADTRTDAATAYGKLVEMRSNGVHLVLGPESSEECRILKTYANLNDVLLLSSASSAEQLAITNDNLMRLMIDDSNQAKALAQIIRNDGITDLAVLCRTDIYGEGLYNSVIAEFKALGGNVFASNWCPRLTIVLPEVMSNLATQVGTRVAQVGANRVAVFAGLYDEGIDAMRLAAGNSALSRVRWYGSDGMAENEGLLEDAMAAVFAANAGFVCSTFQQFTNTLYAEVESNVVAAAGGQSIPRYPMTSYDALRIAAEAVKKSGSTVTMDQLIAAIREAATNYSGCTTPIEFNAADDRAKGGYDFYEVVNVGASNRWSLLEGRAPSAPGNVIAGNGLFNDRVRLRWNSVSGATGYEIWRSDSLATLPTLIARCWNIQYADTNVLAGQLYYYWLRATNSFGASAFSDYDTGYCRTTARIYNDYDGDWMSDPAVYTPATGVWSIKYSGGGTAAPSWGFAGSTAVCGDYNGDGKSDLAVFGETTGRWFIRVLNGPQLAKDYAWGYAGVTPVPGDYDGDGADDLAVYDETAGAWYIRSLARKQTLAWKLAWGGSGAKAVSGDYNDDGYSDLAVFYPGSGKWYIYSLATGKSILANVAWGWASCTTVPGDFDGDGRSDLAVYDPTTHLWFVYSLETQSAIVWKLNWGFAGGIPVSGDYDGDGQTDFALYNPSTGKWFIRNLAGTVLAWDMLLGGNAGEPVKP